MEAACLHEPKSGSKDESKICSCLCISRWKLDGPKGRSVRVCNCVCVTVELVHNLDKLSNTESAHCKFGPGRY